MASSAVQIPLCCQLCDTGRINWKCFECEKCICDSCLKIHSRIKIQSGHRIVNIKDVGIIEFDLQIVKSYKTDFSGISAIIPIDDREVWITGSTDDKRIQRIRLGDGVEVLQEVLGFTIMGGAALNSDTILIRTLGGKTVKSLTKEGVKKTFCDISPQMVRAICVSNDRVLVASFERISSEDEKFALLATSKRLIHIFNSDGQEIKVLENDESGSRLFTFAASISVNKRGDIIVVDEFSHYKSRVVCFDQGGKILWRYDGNADISPSLFITGIAVTPEGNIVLIDVREQLLHILNDKGQLIYCKYTTEINIPSPCNVAILSPSEMIVSNVFLGQKLKDKLNIVKYQGF